MKRPEYKHYELTTDRLGLRRWVGGDSLPFAEMNQDPLVMRYFPRTRSRSESDSFIARIEQHFSEHGYGLFAVDLLSDGEFMGFIGLYTPTFEADFTPCTEIGWRLHHQYWGKGYATEGALACLRVGFDAFSLPEIFSFTAAVNTPSIAVMRRIGLRFRKTFSHPRIDPESELSKHVLYSMSRSAYGGNASTGFG